jgi:hypothetical protein
MKLTEKQCRLVDLAVDRAVEELASEVMKRAAPDRRTIFIGEMDDVDEVSPYALAVRDGVQIVISETAIYDRVREHVGNVTFEMVEDAIMRRDAGGWGIATEGPDSRYH